MRTISYVILLPFAWFGSYVAFGWIGSMLFRPMVGMAPEFFLAAPISFLISIPGDVVKLLILYRVFCWIKNRSIYPPKEYTAGFVVVGVIVSVFMVMVISGYGYLIHSKALAGLSGIPLGLSLGISGLLSVIPVLVVEFRNFYAAIPGQS